MAGEPLAVELRLHHPALATRNAAGAPVVLDGLEEMKICTGYKLGDKVIDHISPDKDVDGFHPYNIGRLAVRMPTLKGYPERVAPTTARRSTAPRSTCAAGPTTTGSPASRSG